MIDRRKWVAAIDELLRMKQENCAVQGDEIALACELAELENKYEKVLNRLALRSTQNT